MQGLIGSQNGQTNSGHTRGVNWLNSAKFEHWTNVQPEWFGQWNSET